MEYSLILRMFLATSGFEHTYIQDTMKAHFFLLSYTVKDYNFNFLSLNFFSPGQFYSQVSWIAPTDADISEF